MCGRYELHSNPVAIALAFGLDYPPEIHARYNIAPMQPVPIVRVNADGARELVQVRWGLVPRWAKDPAIGARMINARAETVATRGAFRMPYRRHRCIFPADGFYEWKATARGKQPVHIAMRDGEPFGLAGVYERWLSPAGEPLDTCAIVTTEANALLRPLHDRMPLILPRDAYERWLDPAESDPRDLVAPYPGERMRWQPVSTKVNNAKNDDASCIEAIVADDEDLVATEEPPALADDDDQPDEAPAQSSLF